MEFDGFDWDEGNLAKCQKHDVTIDDIESVFATPVLILPDKPNLQGERRFCAIGTTRKGRRAFVVFTMRGLAIRPISARHMHKREVNNYENTYPDFRDR